MSKSANFRDVFDRRSRWAIEVGDVRNLLRGIPDNTVHCVCTSPPYFGLRDYQTASWDGGDSNCDHRNTSVTRQEKSRASSGLGGSKETVHASHVARGVCPRCGAVRVDSQIGLEETPEEYVAAMVEVFREVRRVLRPDGVCWINLGDSYNGSGGVGGVGKQHTNQGSVDRPDKRAGYGGLKQKDLIGIPWMTAFALRADGWYLRQWMPWVKRSPMPESVTDRPGTACETVFLLSKSPHYYFDWVAGQRQSRGRSDARARDNGTGVEDAKRKGGDSSCGGNGETRQFRSGDLWFDSVGALLSDDGTFLGLDVTTQPYKEAHFAVFPEKLVRPLILAGTSEKGVCPDCGAPWERVVEKDRVATRPGTMTKVTGDTLTDGNRDPERHVTKTKTVGWNPSCKCGNPKTVPAIVLDPFAGSGTTLAVAVGHNRRAIGVELNPDYADMARRRVGAVTVGFF